MLKVGVIGTGGMGSRHVRNLHNQTPAQVVAVMDVDRAQAEAAAAIVGGCTVYTDAQALVDDPEVQAVVIASPDPYHAAAALACIAAGKPTLCEKPLALTLEEAKQVLDSEVAGGKRLMQLAFMREYDPQHRAVKDVVEKGELGDIIFFRGIHTGYALPQARTAEDIIINSSVHDIHSARWLLQEEITQVFSQSVPSDPQRPETSKFVSSHLTFKNGSLGVLEEYHEAPFGYQVDVELIGTKASIRTPRAVWPTMMTAGKEWKFIDDNWLMRFDLAYIYEVQAWVQSVIDGVPTGPTTWDGYAAMVVADACVESFKSGKVQDVPELVRPSLYA
ncbi:MAG: Gfo/Idh/MocA family oxidoreductase [Ardenticatenaceae bacterium]|nr:Gfo/Idh/MocA family oxidoreductase [Ardenticatenaceae bacterium]